AFIKAVQAIVRVVTWFVNNAARLASLVNSVIDSVMAIASGDIGGAASHIEQSLAKALPTVIGFLADLLGLGGISQKVQQIITKVRSPIEKAITWLVQKAVALGKKLWALLKGKGKGKDKDKDKDKPGEDTGDPTKPGTTPEDERYHGQLADEAISQLQQRPVTEGADFKTARAEKEAQAREIEQTYTAKLKPGIKMTISFEAATESAEADNDLDFTVLIAPNDTKKKASLPFKSVEQQVNVGVRGPDGQVLEQTSLSGKMEDILLKVRQLQFNQTDITAETILQKRNYALANIQVSGHTKGGILVVKTFPITNSQLLSIYSSGTGAVAKEAIKLKVVDANGKQLRAGKLTPEVESIAPELFIAPGAQIVTPETKELTSFIGKLSEALDSRGYVASLDKHSEQAAWQAFRQNDGSIAAMIDECDIVKIVHVSINIHSERQMCPVCAAASNHMISNLASEAPAVFEMLKKKQAMLNPETSVTSTFEFQGSAPNGPSTTRVTQPTGHTRPQNLVTSQTVQDVTSQTFDLSGKVE
ncbi:MAG TPA: hypothetical protein VFS21_16975, partial [Roseiflexaceae bacterium]|nr:hypothetical protein [Roseiflexaceae bacterium]